MGKYIGPKNKIARRFKVNLGLKVNDTKVARRLNQAPGVHGPKRRFGSVSSYGKQLLEKQIDFCKKYITIFNYTKPEFEKYIKDKKNYMGKFWEYDSNETKLVKIQLKTIQRKLEKIKEETK